MFSLLDLFVGYDPYMAIIFVAIIILLIINVCQRLLINQAKANEVKARTKELSAQMKEYQKEGKTDKTKELLSEMMAENNKLMRMNMKPMIVSLIVVILLLPSMATVYGSNSVVVLPFSIPFFGGNALSWFWWYLFVSIPIALFIRKLFKIQV